MNIPLTPKTRRFVERQVKTGRYQNAGDVIQAALQRMEVADGLAGAPADIAALSDLNGADIEALAFVVMMEAAESAQADLKMIMAEVKAMTNAKARLRDLIKKVNRDVAANAGCGDGLKKLNFAVGLGSETAYHRAAMPMLDPEAPGGVRLKPCDLHRGKIESYEQLVMIQDGLKDQLDSLSEMSQMTSLRLQMAMDRRSKYTETLSNLMKKISATADTLVQNLK